MLMRFSRKQVLASYSRIAFIVCRLCLVIGFCEGAITLHTSFNVGGVRGNITFYQPAQDDNVTISVHLVLSRALPPLPLQETNTSTEQSKSFAWAIHTFPVLYDNKAPCSSGELGQIIHDLSRKHGPIIIPPPNGTVQTFVDSDLELQGVSNIWGRSLLLRSMASKDESRTCSNIQDSGDVKTLEAIFNAPVAGQVIFRQSEQGDTTIFSNLFHTAAEYTQSSRHEWKILVTDVLDTADAYKRGLRKCDYLNVLYDPDNADDAGCTTEAHRQCKIGDLARKHGELAVGTSNNRYSKRFFLDSNLPLASVDTARYLYLVLYEKGNPTRIQACAPLNPIRPREIKAHFNMDGVKGYIRFSQRYSMDPTVVTVDLKKLRGRGAAYSVHSYPVPDRTSPNEDGCSEQNIGPPYNPFGVDRNGSPPPAVGTSDEYEVGDLSGKYGHLNEGPLKDFHFGIYADFNLPLFGRHSVMGRSVAVYNPDGRRWICAIIGYPEHTQMAVATFFYPVVGQVIFRQIKNEPWTETTVQGDLSYSDGTLNNTENHRWDIHDDPPGRDFYNWTRRCESAGKHYNPHEVGHGKKYDRNCYADNGRRCEMGDLTLKLGRVNVAARKGTLKGSRFFFTDINLPLSGSHHIVGRSLVIHDDHAPPHRGDRLACTPIRAYHPVRAAVRSWNYGRYTPSNITGSVRLSQQAPGDVTELEVELDGLNEVAHAYHVHELPVPLDKEFPCTADAVAGHFNPFGVNVSLGPAPGVGTVDQYEVGDLSGKYGNLDGKNSERVSALDANLPLFGPAGVVGRSVVVHKKERNFRWACGTIVPEYKKENSRLVIGIASFDQPDAFLQGFIRMRQLEYADGGTSDTWLDVDLRYPGKFNKNVTSGHSWSVFVNQVAHDAVEKTASVRCIASGYLWNPYIVKSDDDLYRTDCGLHNPFRCEMGDLTGRHGTITIGSGKKVFTDVNLPLVGNYSVMGRSVIIFDRKNHKLGCANIKPDVHLVKHVAVRKFPGFSSDTFMDHMRELLNTTDWLVFQDAHQQRDILDGQCVQLIVHFYGSKAHKNQLEFGNLLNLGSVRKQTRFGLRKIETFYKPCRNQKDLDNGSTLGTFSLPSLFMALVVIFSFWKCSTRI